MPNYDIRDAIETAGLDVQVNDTPGRTKDWTIVEIEAERIRIEYGDHKVWVEQQGPQESDLPFRLTRIIPPGDELRLAEGDHLRDIWSAAEAYMLGFEEGHDAIIGLG
jgi:hypothetical protein